MNNDGWGFLGAGTSDNRLAGQDLQHNRQTRTGQMKPIGEHRMVRQSAGQGGPMKEALDAELARHRESKAVRLQHMQDHYTR